MTRCVSTRCQLWDWGCLDCMLLISRRSSARAEKRKGLCGSCRARRNDFCYLPLLFYSFRFIFVAQLPIEPFLSKAKASKATSSLIQKSSRHPQAVSCHDSSLFRLLLTVFFFSTENKKLKQTKTSSCCILHSPLAFLAYKLINPKHRYKELFS